MWAIDIRELHEHYGAIHALDNVTVRVPSGGHIVALLGPNGAGKTTLIEIIEGLRQPTSGSLTVLGLSTSDSSSDLLARLGVQLQATAFIPELTVAETLRLFGAFYPSSGATDDVLGRVRLTDKHAALVRTLSGGQSQRLALGAAMLHDPELYLLDEPTSGLDPIARRQIHEILRALKARGKTVIVSSHYLDEVEALADRVIVLAGGRVVADGTPLELLSTAAGGSTLWVEVYDSSLALVDIPGAEFAGRDGPLVRYRTSDPTGAIVVLAAALERSGATLNSDSSDRRSKTSTSTWSGHPRHRRRRRGKCIMLVRSVWARVIAQLTEIRRSKSALFWMTAFPIGFLLLFGYVMARGAARVTTILLPGLLTITMMSGAVFGVALPLVQLRETGWLRRLRVTPVRAMAITLAHGIAALITGAVALVVLLAIDRALFGVTPAGSVVSLAVVFLFGAWSLVSIGLVVGSAARDMKTAPAIANLLFFPLMFLSGSALPFAVMPEGVRRFARLLPTTYLVDAYTSVFVRGETAWSIAGSLAAMVGIGAVGLWLAARLFRWEGTDPLPRRALATTGAGFGVVLAVTAFAAPAFRHGEIATARRIDAGPAAGQLRVLRGATVLDGLGGRIEHARLVIRDNRVDSIGPDDDALTVPAGAAVDDWSGRFILPGLIDSHVHWGGSGGIGAAPIERTEYRLLHDLSNTLALGVTSVVSLTDDLADMQGLATAVAAGTQIAPRTFFSARRSPHPARIRRSCSVSFLVLPRG